MTLGSYVTDDDEMMLAQLCKDYAHGTKVAERFRKEVSRADDNARIINDLKQQIKGMQNVIRIQAEARR